MTASTPSTARATDPGSRTSVCTHSAEPAGARRHHVARTGQPCSAASRPSAPTTGATTPRTTVGEGQAPISTPTLVGQTLADARQRLGALGLHVVVTQVASTQPAGTIVDQAPKPGARLQKGWDVVLSVAR